MLASWEKMVGEIFCWRKGCETVWAVFAVSLSVWKSDEGIYRVEHLTGRLFASQPYGSYIKSLQSCCLDCCCCGWTDIITQLLLCYSFVSFAILPVLHKSAVQSTSVDTFGELVTQLYKSRVEQGSCPRQVKDRSYDSLAVANQECADCERDMTTRGFYIA